MRKLTPKEVSERLRKGFPVEHTAYHEAGHAVVAFRLGYEIEKVTIIPSPRRRSLGKVVVTAGLADSLESSFRNCAALLLNVFSISAWSFNNASTDIAEKLGLGIYSLQWLSV
jgi:hypothetical protein